MAARSNLEYPARRSANGESSANFDIYLPLRLARHNKVIFGTLFAGALLLTIARWQGWLR